MWTVTELVIRVGVGGLLVLAGFAKFSTTASWRVEWLDSYKLLPQPLLRPAAWLLPLSELVAGTTFALGACGRGGAIGAAALLLIVTAAVVIALLRKQQVSCGCLGKVGTLISWPVVARNVVLVAAVALTAMHRPTSPALTGFSPPVQVGVIGAVVAVLGLLTRRRRPFGPADARAARPELETTTESTDLPFPLAPSPQEAHS